MPPYPFVLAEEEIRQARQMAEEHWHVDPRPLSPLDRVQFIKAELLPASQAETSQRHVMVIHYRYRGDETIHTMIDLARHQVLKVEKFHHFPTGLAGAEIQRAEELARGDERLKPLLHAARPPIRFQARPIQFSQPGDPYIGHRLVQLLPYQGNESLSSPRVLVDLHTETVHLETDISQ